MSDSLSDSLNAILSDPSAMAEVRSMMEGMRPSESTPKEDPILENMAKIQQVYSRMNTENDPRMALMSSIEPYLNPKRTEGLKQAMKMMRMTRLAAAFREMDFFG